MAYARTGATTDAMPFVVKPRCGVASAEDADHLAALALLVRGLDAVLPRPCDEAIHDDPAVPVVVGEEARQGLGPAGVRGEVAHGVGGARAGGAGGDDRRPPAALARKSSACASIRAAAPGVC